MQRVTSSIRQEFDDTRKFGSLINIVPLCTILFCVGLFATDETPDPGVIALLSDIATALGTHPSHLLGPDHDHVRLCRENAAKFQAKYAGRSDIPGEFKENLTNIQRHLNRA